MKKCEDTKIKIIPYVQIDGVWTFRDSEIANVYYRIMDESPHVFKDGSINTVWEFIGEFKNNTGNQLFISILDDDPVGLIWFNQFQYSFAQGHFCFFKKYWGNPVNLEAAEKTLKIFFKYNSCRTVIGIIPGGNTHGINGLKKLGARIVGIIEDGYPDKESGSVEEAVIIQFMRSDYEAVL